MLADLHCHSFYSKGIKIIYEGINSPSEMAEHAKRIGLGAFALTDHNTINGHREARIAAKKQGILFIPGEEITTANGHLVALGINEEIPEKKTLEETIDIIHSQGAVAISAHPFDFRRCGLGKLAKRCDAVEVFNALSLERIGNWKARRFCEKNKLNIVAGSDAHSIEMMGHGLTSFNSESLDGILKDIKKGNTCIVIDYIPAKVLMDWGMDRIKLSYASIIEYMNTNYSWPKRAVARNLLGIAEKTPSSVDYLIKAATYFSIGSIILYSAVREIVGVR